MNLIDEIAPVTVPNRWTHKQDQNHLRERLGLGAGSPDDYEAATVLLADSCASLDEALTAAVESLLREDEDRLRVAEVLPAAAKVEALGKLLGRHPAGDDVALRHALVVAEFAVNTGARMAARFVVEGKKVTLFELAEAADWMVSGAVHLDEALRESGSLVPAATRTRTRTRTSASPVVPIA